MEMRTDPINLKHIFSRLGYSRFACSETRGYACGIALGRKAEHIQVSIMKCHFQYTHAQIIMEEVKIWYLTSVHASPLEDRKKELRIELTNIAPTMN